MTKEAFKQKLKNLFFIRLHMSLIMVGTVGTGFICSVMLYKGGFTDIAWRYVLSALVSYLTFLVLVRVWLVYILGFKKENDSQQLPDSTLDIIDGISFTNLSAPSPDYSGQGGGFSGGGASGTWGDSVKDVFKEADFDADEGTPILIGIVLIGLILVCLGFGVYLVWEAPNFLGEIALEMAISMGLLKQIRNESGDWLGTLFKKTIFFFIGFCFLMFVAMKFITSKYPEVHRAKDLISLIKKSGVL